MKNIILGVLLLFYSTSTYAQLSKRDSTRNAVAAYVQVVNKAADVFLNRRLPTEERLKAIAQYPIIYEDKQVQQFKTVALSNDEKPEIRAMALNKIYQYVETDERLLNQAIQWFGNPETPRALRYETLNLIGNLSFSSLTGTLEVYNKMVNDPDLNFRSFAVSKLVLNGDARAQQLLIQGLDNSKVALFPTAHAIELLSLAPKKEFYPAVYKVLLETQDQAARLAAVQVLGPYKEARVKLIAISQNTEEKEVFRESALRALYSGDKDNIIQYVTPILQDKSASSRLQMLGLQMSIDTRRSMAYRKSKKARKADSFDNLVKNIYERKGVNKSDAVINIANDYLMIVKPKF